MNGTSHLLDTNIIIGVLKGHEPALEAVSGLNITDCGYSAITRMELLGFRTITENEASGIEGMLSVMQYIPLDKTIEDQTIRIRQNHKIKLPDAIIAASALVNFCDLVTLDQDLTDVFSQIITG